MIAHREKDVFDYDHVTWTPTKSNDIHPVTRIQKTDRYHDLRKTKSCEKSWLWAVSPLLFYPAFG